MVFRIDWTFRLILLTIAVFLGLIALRPLVYPSREVLAQAARFDHIFIVSPAYLYKGVQGLLLMDKRNGNVWFIPKGNEDSKAPFSQNPTLVFRIPFEKMDETPR